LHSSITFSYFPPRDLAELLFILGSTKWGQSDDPEPDVVGFSPRMVHLPDLQWKKGVIAEQDTFVPVDIVSFCRRRNYAAGS